MRRHIRAATAWLGVLLLFAGTVLRAQAPAQSAIEEIRKELLQLPYYGVFDFIAFGYAKGTVTLVGYAYHPGLKADAERAVKRAHGEGTPVKLRDGPAAVRGVALRHQATGASREGGEGGASSQKTCRSPSIPNPSRKEDSWLSHQRPNASS